MSGRKNVLFLFPVTTSARKLELAAPCRVLKFHTEDADKAFLKLAIGSNRLQCRVEAFLVDELVVAALATQGLTEFVVVADAVLRTLDVQPSRRAGEEPLEPAELKTRDVVVMFKVDVAPDFVV